MKLREMGWGLVLAAVCTASAAGAQDQTGRTTASDAAFRRAIALVNDGEGQAGRAVLDSMVNAAAQGSLELAEALYWRATVAPSAAEAEHDYKRIILEHALSPRVPDALLRLAQLELARGDRENAIRRLRRLDLEYPGYPARARTSYWLARAYLEQNDLQRGCVAVTEARGRAPDNDVELRNQIDFLALRCPTASASVATGTPPSSQTESARQPEAAPTETAPPPAPRPELPASDPAAAETGGAWSVQVAAFNTRPQANALAERLRGRGYQARVDGSAAPFRVRIGRYPTRAAAATALQEIKARGMDGFITDVGTR
jgi:cell division septation protein DedD